ncbi:hypothetical protein [Clostridium felsineum]|uniref:Uncharacterized protein n=2 Tax=Clostridium felsineum TaxID=36839 RepID=A0A1S8L030_9CLOT|nr:hypothetical protein [Clostridium felsineum]URZ06468.1 hypothetical protein CLROS_018010 [Clostridium felsineum]URZ11503.1 hypothetical protein CROST_022200 [Clostridium felsineum]
MASNTGNGYRKGPVKGRSQTHNPKTDTWVERDTSTGRFINGKTSSDDPFKGVRKEK